MAGMMVSAGEAARRLGVAPATIQRWVDHGLLHAERTAGGHRRIHVAELRRLMAANRPPASSGPLLRWLEVLLTGDSAQVRDALIASRQRSGSWAETADEVASAIAEIGRQWEAGDCQVFEEHAATEALRRAAAACAGRIRYPQGASCTALFTIENERHTLGLTLAELVVAEQGSRPQWIGEGPPAGELSALIKTYAPRRLLVSASPASLPQAIAHYEDALVEAVRVNGVDLIIAGAGRWRENGPAKRVSSFKELREALS